jgi:hypothetical protein
MSTAFFARKEIDFGGREWHSSPAIFRAVAKEEPIELIGNVIAILRTTHHASRA